MWGSDFPYILPPCGLDYAQAAGAMGCWWGKMGLTGEEYADITRGTAKRLFWRDANAKA